MSGDAAAMEEGKGEGKGWRPFWEQGKGGVVRD